jgi:hypothetical protein
MSGIVNVDVFVARPMDFYGIKIALTDCAKREKVIYINASGSFNGSDYFLVFVLDVNYLNFALVKVPMHLENSIL